MYNGFATCKQFSLGQSCICVFLFIALTQPIFAEIDPLSVSCDADQLEINTDQLSVKELLYLLKAQCGITISGLKLPEDYPVTYHGQGPVLQMIKRLLRYLEAESYVFEFNGEQLSHVLIFSKGKTTYSLPPPGFFSDKPDDKSKTINAVKVLDIVPGSQAEVHGFQKGDFIIEYDSVAIHSASQLVSEVQKKKNLQRVDMVIIRNQSRMSYVINSGLIGVRIQTVRVSEDELK